MEDRNEHQTTIDTPEVHLRRAGRTLMAAIERAGREMRLGFEDAATELRAAAASARARIRPSVQG